MKEVGDIIWNVYWTSDPGYDLAKCSDLSYYYGVEDLLEKIVAEELEDEES